MTDPDLRTLHHDDRLLDRIGRGERVADGDAEAMLSAWRRTLPVAGPPDPGLVAAVTTPPARPKRRLARTSLGVAASVALLSGGLMVGAAYVNPDSPLWPVTRFVYGNIAEAHTALDDANHAVAGARTAVGRGRYAEAVRLLAAADELAGKVDEPDAAKRLRDDIAAVRAQLPPGPRTTSGSTSVQPPAGSVDAPPSGPRDAWPRDTPPGHAPYPGHGPGSGHEENEWPGDQGKSKSHEGKANKPRPHNLPPAPPPAG